MRIGTEAARAWDPACDWTRLVTFRPADGARATLNPPRFSWPYLPGVFPAAGERLEPHPKDREGFLLTPALFTLEIARAPDFEDETILFRAERTPYNFYNALPLLPAGIVYWRVAYLTESGALRCWSETRSIEIAAAAEPWDRSNFLKLEPAPRPRLLAGKLDEARRRAGSSADCKAILDTLSKCEGATQKSWWNRMPGSDRLTRQEFARSWPDAGGGDFTTIANNLAHLAFKRALLGGDLAEVAARAARIAELPLGGLSGPEGAPGSLGADVAQLPEFLAVVYDFCRAAADPRDLAALRAGIAWRVRYTFENFAWRAQDGTRVPYNSLAVSGSSHPFEAGMGMLCAAALLAGDPDLAPDERDLFTRVHEFGLHWLVGITNGFGTEDGWNEGPGYGNSKMQWLMNAVAYCDLARPELQLGRNPALKAIGDFFLHTSPLGLYAAPFSNGSSKRDYVLRNRMSSAYRLAYLLNDGTFRRTWAQSGPALEALGAGAQAEQKRFWNPWLAFGLAARGEAPREADAPAGARLFENSGWLCVNTESPNRPDRFASSTGMIVQARPVGGYQHSFFSDGSPQLWAFGEPLNYGSGTTANKDPYAYSALSANTVLVNGVGQRHLCHWRLEHFKARRLPRQIARFAAYKELKDGVYALADLTNGYSDHAGPAGHWWGDLQGPYQEGPLPKLARALRHFLFMRGRYFVMLDDLELAPGEAPAAFTWLWHVLKESPLETPAAGRVAYRAGAVRVDLAHVHEAGDLAFEDRAGLLGALNPLTGEDYRAAVEPHLKRPGGEAVLMAHNFWFTAKTRAARRQFLTVVYPTRREEPAPTIEAAGRLAVRVRGPHGNDLIDFGGQTSGADLAVEAAALAEAADSARREAGAPREVHA
ncbi:MAG: DUF4962 domain-containing protein [Planctomycetota bacterium]|nr:DUF4962 domain-containing protein [Planctomycetota bacterium]